MNGLECYGFEGAEKKIEIDFCRDPSNPDGLRSVPQHLWEEVLDVIKCQIISSTKNKWFDSYVLSESSLFVYPYKIILKTCGTTVLLKCVEPILTIAANECDLTPEFVFFSRKNFLYPEKQLYPHSSLNEELELLKQYFENGECMTYGSHTGDNWVFYYADLGDASEKGILHNDQTFEIMMTHLDKGVMQQFYANEENMLNPKEVTRSSGISELIPGSITDEKMFEPCGYSVNGLCDDSYFTIHITPEDHCSYVSFETNVSHKKYTRLAASVIETFKPGKFIITLFADSDALCGSNPLGSVDVRTIERLGYKMTNRTFSDFSVDGNYSLLYVSFQSVDFEERNQEVPMVGDIEDEYPIEVA